MAAGVSSVPGCGFALAAALVFAAMAPASVRADGPGDAPAAERFAFVPYAAAYSLETKQPDIVDPLVFVIAPHASPATGYFGIAHLPGIRNARMADDPMQPALDANGKPLGFDLQHWFAATGIVELVPEGTGRDRVTARFTNLVPNGRYSIFIARSAGALPLESRGTSFVAAPDGTGGIDAIPIASPVSGGTVLLVFHSDRGDGAPRTPDRGEIGIYSHVQLAAPIP
jgi:hypothetical protein